MSDNVYPKCSVCHEVPAGGLYDGIRLNGQLICTCCQQQIMAEPVATQPYHEHIDAIKHILFARENHIMAGLCLLKNGRSGSS